MSLTLAQAELYTTNMVYRGIIEEFVRQSPVFGHLPFIEIEGNAYQYLRESTRSSAAFYDPLDTWTENTPTATQITVGLKILGTDADIDNFLRQTRSDKTDIEGEIIMEKVKAVKFTFLDNFYYGDTTVNAKAFAGVHSLIGSARTIERGTSSAAQAGRIQDLDQLVETAEDGPPDLLVMPKAIRRGINAYVRANGLYEQERDQWGNMISMYQGIPMYVDDSLVTTEAITTTSYSGKTGGTSCGSIFALRFGNKDLFGVQNGGSIAVKKIRDEMDDKDAERWRIKWYCGLGLGSTIGNAKMTGVASATAWTS